MKAIILAAGIGSRLRPQTDSIPKCMVPVNSEPIIHKQISNLIKNGFNPSDITVIAGWKYEVLLAYLSEHFTGVNVITNRDYLTTNNMYSLYLAKNMTGDDSFLLMNADVFYDENIVADLIESPSDNMIACDRSGYMEESMKITVDENGFVKNISKAISEADYYAVSIDVYKIGKPASKALFEEIKSTIETDKNLNSWTEVALDHIFDRVQFTPMIIRGRWFEIDNHDDLSKAETLFKQ